MSAFTHETALTESIQVGGVRYGYRRFGERSGAPLLFLGYFNSNMDAWDPKITNGLAETHEVILFDNAGVGASSGTTPNTVTEMTKHCVAFCRALELKNAIVVGFSLGGMVAQQLALDHSELVQRLILLGTGPRGGEDMTFTELSAEEQTNPVAFLLGAFFAPSKTSQAAGREYVERLKSRKKDIDSPVSRSSAEAQLAAIREWGTKPKTDRFAYLFKITQPVFIVHGNKDVVVTPTNGLLLAESLPNATLIVYSDSSHAAHSQHAEEFLHHARLLLQD
jgi:pimeloyl-ACP methyl ester carboxylesterase